MFIKVERDFFVNINLISSYILRDNGSSLKLILYINGKLAHTILYLKSNPEDLDIISDFVTSMRDFQVNPDVIGARKVDSNVEESREEEAKETINE